MYNSVHVYIKYGGVHVYEKYDSVQLYICKTTIN